MGLDGIVLVELGLVVLNDFVGFEEAEMIPLDLLQTQKLISAPNPETIEFFFEFFVTCCCVWLLRDGFVWLGLICS